MRKSFIILLSLLFVLGSFVAVYADDGGMDSVRSAVAGSKVIIGGDAYVEGYWLGNHDMDDTVDADDRFWNQRVRLKIHAAIGGVEVRTRLTTGDQEWDMEAGNTGSAVAVDYAYLHVPVGGPVTLDFGRQKSDWGNKLFQWNVNSDRAKVTVDIVDKVTFGVYADKIDEMVNVGDDNLKEIDDYALFAIANLGTVEAGVLGILRVDAREETPAGVGDDGNAVSLFANAEFAGVNIGTELAAVMGDIIEYTNIITGEVVDDPQLGFFASGGYAFGPVAVDALFGLTMNGYVADNHFNPTVMIGTDQTTAITEFGGRDVAGVEVTSDTMLFAATASFQAIPDQLSIYGRFAFGMSDEEVYKLGGLALVDETYEDTAIELDAGLEFQIADNTTFLFDVGYLMLDAESGGADLDLDAAFSVGQSINIVF
jgi:hypothetical protein